MKRMTYVDKDGKQIDQSLENRRPLLKFFFVFGTILPLILIMLIIVAVFQNKKCSKIYNKIKEASLVYAESELTLPEIEGDSITVNIGELYSEQYLKSTDTDNILCSGNVKITKYKEEYIYTLDVRNCNSCSTDKKYGNWSKPQNSYPKNKSIVDVIAYYNYYEREMNQTKWSKDYEQEELSEEVSEYGMELPKDMTQIPEIPSGSNIYTYEREVTKYYRYRDRKWKWYDIKGEYSEFSSEQPEGYQNKDENTSRYTDWSNYSTDYPEEKQYRRIEQAIGYKFYYLNEKKEKIYFNNGNWTSRNEVDTTKYDHEDSGSATIYHYKDQQWRWYNGQKRQYSNFSSVAPVGISYKDEGLESISNWSSWETTSHFNAANKTYRVEESKTLTRFRVKYENLSELVLHEPLEKKAFEAEVGESIKSFGKREDVKLEVTYKFKYRK